MRLLPEGVQFQPSCLSKQSRPGNPPKPFFSHPFLQIKDCVQSRHSFNTSLGQSPLDQQTQVRKIVSFISYMKPHYPITSSSIARWITSLLKLAGIDTETFKAHSKSSISASVAASAGLTTNQIMEAAD